jgi:ribosomal protein S15P/S13E
MPVMQPLQDKLMNRMTIKLDVDKQNGQTNRELRAPSGQRRRLGKWLRRFSSLKIEELVHPQRQSRILEEEPKSRSIVVKYS